ncbi:PREDICTED: uncharacterized protein PFB0145c-like [Papilio xuthus]|uniref:Uncharacterized protein PFB0145c-like n=1 Tax=Papilio xuthus TaxID=66420 RepID=A0AAJ6ZVP4_PAPXU|nr:PREDICTED: uncharacterized protein PFB0145c-like [Papilio xuthus]
MKIIKNLLENETKCRIQDKIDANKQLRLDNIKHIEYKKKLEENRKKEQENNDRLNQVWREYYDRVRCKKNTVHEEIKKKDSSKKLHLFQTLERLKEIEENKYNDFVDKGIKRLAQQVNKDSKHKVIQKQNIENKKPCSNKSTKVSETQMETNHRQDTKNISRLCHCDRQTLVCKPSKKNCNNAVYKKEESLQFSVPRKSLEDELKRREKEPFPWSGTKATHEQFAQEANKILGECRYKTMARKVVDEYIKINGLNTNNLPITNYL